MLPVLQWILKVQLFTPPAHQVWRAHRQGPQNCCRCHSLGTLGGAHNGVVPQEPPYGGGTAMGSLALAQPYKHPAVRLQSSKGKAPASNPCSVPFFPRQPVQEPVLSLQPAQLWGWWLSPVCHGGTPRRAAGPVLHHCCAHTLKLQARPNGFH